MLQIRYCQFRGPYLVTPQLKLREKVEKKTTFKTSLTSWCSGSEESLTKSIRKLYVWAIKIEQILMETSEHTTNKIPKNLYKTFTMRDKIIEQKNSSEKNLKIKFSKKE